MNDEALDSPDDRLNLGNARAIRWLGMTEPTAGLRHLSLPYAELNLRHNPFGELTESERIHLAVVCIDDVVSSLNNSRQAVQYVGEKGHGKTTHLLKIRSVLPQCGYVHIPEGERRPVPAGEPVLIDEAQRLTWRQRRQLFGEDRALVLGTHHDFEAELKKAGRHVTTIAACGETSLNRLQQIVIDRIEFARRERGPVPTVHRRTLKRLLQSQSGDIRSMLQILYDALQKMTGPEELEL
ncbi:MAG: hypothetical protein ABJZ55_03830 [Fuerstiella sp.]